MSGSCYLTNHFFRNLDSESQLRSFSVILIITLFPLYFFLMWSQVCMSQVKRSKVDSSQKKCHQTKDDFSSPFLIFLHFSGFQAGHFKSLYRQLFCDVTKNDFNFFQGSFGCRKGWKLGEGMDVSWNISVYLSRCIHSNFF